MHKTLFSSILILMLGSCSAPIEHKMDDLAEAYVKLVLEIGQYDSDFVDAYYGPEEWQPTAVKLDTIPAADFLARAIRLLEKSDSVAVTAFSDLEKARHRMFNKQLVAVKTKLKMMSGISYSFDEEAKLLYDAEPPHFTVAHFNKLLETLEEELPGEGELSIRYNNFANQFIIPKDKLDTVFRVAIIEARRRTNHHFKLPENEDFVLEYVNDKSWSGYNYYQGKSKSLIQINTDFPIFIQRAIDLACHEGYPGHHVFNTLLEQNLVEAKGWKEFSVYPLFSPQSLIAEGSANYGIEVAFPGDERVAFEKEVLFPIAGLNAAQADKYYRILDLLAQLNYAGNEAARRYLDGEFTRGETAKWLQKYLFYAPERALQRTRFIDQYRSYVINYNLGKDLVADYVKAKGGTVDEPEKRWAIFKELLSNPHTASSLK
ncbi:hypothetical protein MWU65_15780 [Cellulophaga sp. F20128]|uniref:hypothetical protein n=1 Tax=Cellulophaga sp. F20128 TaxID=2926413 RepID=UPI001FF2930C|nr:hypothetical protein [Cellulophaga sp. F20128]MCK0158651.1 hypothetical protein [Cellulophaga sp. F20128]